MTRSAWAGLVLGVTAAISLWAAWTLLHWFVVDSLSFGAIQSTNRSAG